MPISGGHRGLSTNSNRCKLFNRSKLERLLELQNTHLVLFKSPRELVPNSMRGAKLVPKSELLDLCGDAKSVPYSGLFNDLSPSTNSRLFYDTSSGFVA